MSALNSSPSAPAAPDSAAVRIDGPLVIATVADWHHRLQVRFAAGTPLALDLGGVTAVDVFGLQLLWAAKRSAAEQRIAFSLANAPAVFADACAAHGFPAFNAP